MSEIMERLSTCGTRFSMPLGNEVNYPYYKAIIVQGTKIIIGNLNWPKQARLLYLQNNHNRNISPIRLIFSFATYRLIDGLAERKSSKCVIQKRTKLVQHCFLFGNNRARFIFIQVFYRCGIIEFSTRLCTSK